MMFNRIALIASLLVFLLGTNAFATSNLETPSSIKTEHYKLSHTLIIKASKSEATMKQTQTVTAELKKAEPTIKNYVVPALVGILIMTIFGGYWFIFRKKLFAK